jgi:hypothetical protein
MGGSGSITRRFTLRHGSSPGRGFDNCCNSILGWEIYHGNTTTNYKRTEGMRFLTENAPALSWLRFCQLIL